MLGLLMQREDRFTDQILECIVWLKRHFYQAIVAIEHMSTSMDMTRVTNTQNAEMLMKWPE